MAQQLDQWPACARCGHGDDTGIHCINRCVMTHAKSSSKPVPTRIARIEPTSCGPDARYHAWRPARPGAPALPSIT